MRFLVRSSFAVSITLILSGCHFSSSVDGNYVMVTSVSSDGHYAVTTNMNQHVYLWDLKNKTYKDIDDSVNIYSAYFVKNSDNFMYQKNGSNKVVIKNVSGNIIKEFNPRFATYGEAITSNLKTWIGADKSFQLYLINDGQKKKIFYYWCGANYKDEKRPPKGMPYGCGSFIGDGKLFNINILPNEKGFVTTDGGSDFYLWSLPDGKKLQVVQKSSAQTVNTISPDGKYVVVADQQKQGFLYNLQTQSIEKTGARKVFFFDVPPRKSAKEFFYDQDGDRSDKDINVLTAVRFIDDQHIVVSYYGLPFPFLYLGLYKIGQYRYEEAQGNHIADAVLTKYLPLVSKDFNLYVNQTKPYPETRSFVRDQAMDTSPSAHILVMGQANRGGIMVYKYNPEDKTLKLVWSPTLSQ